MKFKIDENLPVEVVMKQILPLLREGKLANTLWIVEEARVRIRESGT